MKKILAIALLTMFGLAGKSQAASISKSISSTTFVVGIATSDVLMLNPKESMNYSLTGGATGTLLLEKSIDGGSNYSVVFSSVNNLATSTRTGTEYSGEQRSFYRFRASTMTGSGSFFVTMQDNDDFFGELKNNKGNPVVQFWDDTLRFFNMKGIVWNDVAPSTATDSMSNGSIRTVYLTGSVAALEGHVLIATTPVAGQGVSVVVAPATANLTSFAGIAAESMAVNNQIKMYTDGMVNVLSTGTITPGNMVGTAAVAGYVQATTTTPVVGVSFGNGISAGGKLKIGMR